MQASICVNNLFMLARCQYMEIIKKTVDDQFGIIANNDQLKKITNYYPKTDLNDGVKKMIKNLNY